ncbi:precorrin-4 C11-methyltransferase [Ruminiclostridium papyrosolvens DSM 2782]|uniref:Precorrin-4 C11-methyltransferase n=1 Tax=Ruminiclostridium papyrosolvens DSM 2782 TaxID=588581 RepID=F1T8V9_9FIRM|nr:precorrin-4 C(11)-methyltransferase [Ruminiclostridium papyrosolvens]EGD48941.1 precorrin-4 C11-methyltransferase [Ruminiclostridium papyrosolvens DSM 2782]WES35425.1 precorrin-4 C(11)-methyltransferase [Ruminiclostridium papyrosolvens DSM 2782]
MVTFIGAGPGAVDLITVRGKTLLETADIVIYAGSLVNPGLLDYTKKTCEIFNSAEMTLEQVIAVMERGEREQKSTVRLHTGDPSIYGAIREQMDMLIERGIEYTVVPGVSSFCGAAAALKAEYTLPDVSQTLILTRMEGRTPVPEREEISKLASHKSSMALFLSSSLLEELSRRLVAGGYEANTPAAIVYKATWPDEKIVRTCVGELYTAAKENNINKTALILVGDFLGSEYSRSKLYDPTFSHEFREAVK